MEHKFYTDNFERLLKEKSDEFRMYPSKRVWHSIYNDLHPDRKWPSIAASILLVSILFLVGYWNSSADKISQPVILTQSENSNTPPQKKQFAINQSNFASQSQMPAINSYPGQKEIQSGNFSKLSDVASGNNYTKNITGSNPDKKVNQINKHQQSPVKTIYTSVQLPVAGQFVTTAANASARNVYSPANKTNTNNITDPSVITDAEISATFKNKADITGVYDSPITEIKSLEGDDILLSTASKNVSKKAGSQESKPATAKSALSNEDKSWIEHYAFYNKTSRKRWHGRLSSEIYFTPSVGYRNFKSNTDDIPAVPAAFTTIIAPGSSAKNLNHHPGVGFESGFGLSYSVAKNFHIKAGMQVNFTNYLLNVTQINHPVTTTIMLNDLTSGHTYLEARSSTIANIPGNNSQQVHNQTYQLSVPVGFDIKLANKNKLTWYAGAGIQPTYVFGGKNYLISADQDNYISDPSLMRHWSLNGGIETFLLYKLNSNITLKAGPQLRYQFTSTYTKQYTYNEKLYNLGIKMGVVKNF
jgi:hypothetical protein